MPSQKPLIDLDKLDRSRGEQLKAIDGLANRLQPGLAKDGYPVAVSMMIGLMRVFDSVCSPNCPVNWLGQKVWAKMAGISVTHCRRTIAVLKSMGLIEARTTWVAVGKRGMKVQINWSTIFSTDPITQDQEDRALGIAKQKRQRTLFASKTRRRRTSSPDPLCVSESDTLIVSETHKLCVSESNELCVSSISHPQRDPLNHSLEEAESRGPMAEGQRDKWVDGDFESTTEARRHGDEERQQSIHCSAASTGTQRVLSTADHRSARIADVADVCPDHIFQFSPESAVKTVRTTIPAEFDSIVKRLISLGVADGRSAVKKSLTTGYSLDQIRAIVDWYRGEALPDESGKLVFPYAPGQLVLRLRDRDAIEAEPAQGNWQGGKSGFWTRLAPISTPKPRKQPLPAPSATKPDRVAIPTTYTTSLSLSEILAALDAHNAPAMVRQSAGRIREVGMGGGGELPKTLARWMKTVGLPVEERTETSDQSKLEGQE